MEAVATAFYFREICIKLNEKAIYAMHLNLVWHVKCYQYPKGIFCVYFLNKHLNTGNSYQVPGFRISMYESHFPIIFLIRIIFWFILPIFQELRECFLSALTLNTERIDNVTGQINIGKVAINKKSSRNPWSANLCSLGEYSVQHHYMFISWHAFFITL